MIIVNIVIEFSVTCKLDLSIFVNSKGKNIEELIFLLFRVDVTPRKTSEDEQKFRYLDSFLKIFGGLNKNYPFRLNCNVNGSQKKPDLCIMDDVLILNSEVL